VSSNNSPKNEGRVLVFAPTGRDAELTCDFLARAGIDAFACRNVFDVVHEVEHGCAAILLAEEALGTTSIQALTEVLMKQPSWSDIPICIVASGGHGDQDTSRRLALFSSAGNVTVLERPFRPETLINTLQAALRSRRRQYQVRDLVKALGESEYRYRDLAASLETQVAIRTAALAESNKELEAFTYTIAHDLRAPLRAQQSFAEALLEDYGDVLGDTGRDYARRINESADRLNHLVQDLLAFSRLSRAEINIEIIDLRQLVLGICKDMDFQIKEAKADIHVEDFSFAVCANNATLGTAVTNLISNAIKFCQPGVPPEIRIAAEDRGNWVRLNICDNGIGIAPEHHGQVFGIFNRLHKAGDYPGTGVGLAIVQRGVERMGGRVGVESAEGKGSRFWIELKKPKS
jgi:signal transduction histidine kinase